MTSTPNPYRAGDLVIVTWPGDKYVGARATVREVYDGDSEFPLSLEVEGAPRRMVYGVTEVAPLLAADGEHLAGTLATLYPEAQVVAAVETEAVVILETPRGRIVTVRYEHLIGTTVHPGAKGDTTPVATLAPDAPVAALLGILAAL